MRRELLATAFLAFFLGCGESGTGETGPKAPPLSERWARAMEIEALGLYRAAAEEWRALESEKPEAALGRLRCLGQLDPTRALGYLEELGSLGEAPDFLLEELEIRIRRFEPDEARQVRDRLASLQLSQDQRERLERTAWLDVVTGDDSRIAFEQGLDRGWTVIDPLRVSVRAEKIAGEDLKLLSAACDFDGFGECWRGYELQGTAVRLRVEVAELKVLGEEGIARIVLGFGDEQGAILGLAVEFGATDTGGVRRVAMEVLAGAGTERRALRSTSAGVLFPRSGFTADLCYAEGVVHFRLVSGSSSWQGQLVSPVLPQGRLRLGVLEGESHPGVAVALAVEALEVSGDVRSLEIPDESSAELRGNLAAANGETDQAEMAYSEGLREDPFAIHLYLLRGNMRREQGDYLGAARDLAVHSAREGEASDALLQLCKELSSLRQDLTLLEIAEILAPFGDLLPPETIDESRRVLRVQLELTPHETPYDDPLVEARARMVLGERERALVVLNQADEWAEGPARAKLLLLRGEVHRSLAEHALAGPDKQQSCELAERDFEAARELLPEDDARPWIELARIHLIQQEYDWAYEDCTAALERDPNTAEAWFVRGLSRSVHRRTAAIAVQDLKKSVELDPGNGKYYYFLANAWSLARDEEQAQRNYERALLLGFQEARSRIR